MDDITCNETHAIYGTGLFTYIQHKKSTVPMDGMGYDETVEATRNMWVPTCRWKCRVSLGYGPFPVTVITRIITFLVGNPYKPLFATVTGKGPHPRYLSLSLSLSLSPSRAPSICPTNVGYIMAYFYQLCVCLCVCALHTHYIHEAY